MDMVILYPFVYCSSDLALHLNLSSSLGYRAPWGRLSEDLLGKAQTREATTPFTLCPCNSLLA